MASIIQALKKVQFTATKPLVKLASGERLPLSAQEQERVPPGQFVTDRFPVLHRETKDEIPAAEAISAWTLTVDGEVNESITLSLDDLKKMPHTALVADMHCVTSWTRFDNRWHGVRVRDVLERAGVSEHAAFLTQTARSGHTTSTPLADMLADDALLAWQHDGKPLPLEHGGPLRVVLPRKYAYKGVKWVTRLTLTKKEDLGFWERHGYSQTADPWTNDRYS